jgi:hypothetical protein
MSKAIGEHIRSNVIGYLALFVALSGTAYAVDGPLPGQNQVGSADIINDEVYSADVRNDSLSGGGLAAADLASNSVGSSEVGTGAIGTGEVADNSIRTFHILDNEVRSGDVRDDSLEFGGLGPSDLGPSSVGSSEIASSAVNANEIGELGIHPHEGTPVSVPGGGVAQNGSYDTETATAQCNSGEELIAGSGKFPTIAPDAELFITGVYMNYTSEQVSVVGGNDSGTARNLVAVATCLEGP